MMRAGNIVWLNGTSSAGKTTTARALQKIMECPYWHTGGDHFGGCLPAHCFVPSDGMEPAMADGWLLVFRDGVVQTFEAEGEGGTGGVGYARATLAEVQIGPFGLRFLEGKYRAIAALAMAGIDVIVDDAVYDRRVLRAGVEAQWELPVLFVGLYCPREVVLERERARGNRAPGGAAAFYDLVHAHAIYDLELDTSVLSPEACATRIKEALQNELPRTALRRLRQREWHETSALPTSPMEG